MRRSLVIAASTAAIATLGAGPALAHDRPGTKTAKAGSIQLRCRPVAGPPALIRCEWTPRQDGPFSYELFRKVLGSEGRPAVVSTGTDREYEDEDVVGGTRYANKVPAVHENGKSARSRVVVVRCCDERPGRRAGEGKVWRGSRYITTGRPHLARVVAEAADARYPEWGARPAR